MKHIKSSLPLIKSLAGLALALVPAGHLHAIVLDGEVEAGGVVDDGNGDIYDDFGFLFINGQPYTGAASGADPVYAIAAQTVAGINVSGQVNGFDSLGLDGGDTDFRIVRWWFTLTNPSASAKSLHLMFGGGVGSDEDTILTASSGFPPNWIVTADDPGPTPSDPVVGHVFSSPKGLVIPGSSVFAEPDGTIGSDCSLVIAPGATLSLVFFATARNITGSNAGDSTTEDVLSDLKNVLLDGAGNVKASFLANGLAAASNAVNHSLANGNTRILGVKSKVRPNGSVAVSGRALSDFGIGQVDFFVGNLTGKARGTGRWNFTTTASRTLKVQATDLLGGTSRKVTVRIKRPRPGSTRPPRPGGVQPPRQLN